MIASFDDFFLRIYVMVDDLWREIEPMYRRPGPQAECSDSALLTVTLVGKCRAWDKATTLLSNWQEHRDLFPHIPSPSRFNRRLGNRSALDWVIDQYQVSTDKRNGVTSDPNRADEPRYIVDLVGRVLTVSIETVKIVAGLPEAFAEDPAN
jgi:hypothetical protein